MTDDPTHDEMDDFLKEQGVEDEFDREEAIYWFAADYHGGQSSNLYEALSMSQFNPGAASRGPEDEFAYDLLVDEFADGEEPEDDNEDEGEFEDEGED